MLPISTAWLPIVLVLLVADNVSATQKDVQAEKGATVTLPCDIDSAKCGDLHSIKWYRGSARIFVFSHVASIARPEGRGTDRMNVQYVPGSAVSHLQIVNLELLDEAVYKCEITYMEVRENCDVVQFVNLTTLVRPSEVRVYDKKMTLLKHGSTLGPFNERTKIDLTCEASGGKPVPSVAWYNGSAKMEAEYTPELDAAAGHGVGTGRSHLQVVLSRGDLQANYECRVENDALPEPIVTALKVDVHLRPTKLELSGVESHVVKGTRLLLQCNVYGARPAANVSWYNDTQPVVAETINASELKDDGTYETQSRLIFTATRFENGREFTCEAENAVMRDFSQPTMDQTIKLEVLYPPIITVQPENITVNESVDILIMCNYESNPASLNSAIWLLNGQALSLADENHYEGGNNENTALLIKNVTRDDMGEYTCSLANSVGEQDSENSAYLNVHFKPIVELLMSPSSTVIENERTNVTMYCKVTSGNPDTLLAVRWYIGDYILKELPDCNDTSLLDPMCDSIDPSKMFLQSVEQQFAGNHSCEGMNEAGWGPRSPEVELIVYYPPSSVMLKFEPARVIKKSEVKLTCSVKNPGRPARTQYRWLKGNNIIPDEKTPEYVISHASIETKSNFTCIAYNEGGDSEPDTVYVDVYAPPDFIIKMPPYQGFLYNSKHINISCRVECSPLCNITWLKNYRPIDFDNTDLYYVQETVMPPDSKTNDFESLHSTLIWNMTAWPNEQLDRIYDNANYTCESSTNNVGESPGVKSTTFFAIEYPPENITLTKTIINVTEDEVPKQTVCSAKAVPEPSYQWRREGSPELFTTGDRLIIQRPVPQRDAGKYICEVFNRHGNTTRAVYLNVLFKPECQISQTTINGHNALMCSVKANPEDVDFEWTIKHGNDTVDVDNIVNNKLQSILMLDSNIEEFRTYLCFANNSIGLSYPCERDVSGAIAWWKRFSDDDLLIIVSVIVGLILCVIIICVIIIMVCRRKRAGDKCPSQSNTADKVGLNPGNPSDALTDPDRGFYENLPFHGMQNPPNKPYRPEFSDMDYADVDYRSYGPINYKAASIYAQMKKDKNNKLREDEELL